MTPRTITCSILLACLCVASPSIADKKAFSGSFCKGARASAGVVWNANLTQTSVTCPLIRDRVNSATSLNSATLEGWKQSASAGATTCTLWSQTEDETSGAAVDAETIEQTSAGNFQQTFHITSSDGAEGGYALTCTLQPDDEIYHIQLDETSAASE